MTKLEAPVRPTSNSIEFEASIRAQDPTITLDAHKEHWMDVEKYWLSYYENRQVLAENGGQLDQMIQGMSSAPTKMMQ
jgi:hypothetical protein